MFNKPGVFARNEPTPPRDHRPATPGSQPSAPPNGARASVVNPLAAPPPGNAPALADTTSSLSRELPANDSVMGARLIVGPDVKLKGAEILDCDTLVVEGRVEATMDSRVIRIAEKGSFAGTVSIDIAEIHGIFEGELTARSQLIIHSTGRVSGKIRYGKLVIDEGGELCGDINALSAEKTQPARPRIEPVVALSAATA